MLALARAENMVAATPLRLAICWPTAARMQHSLIFSTLLMRPALMASLNLRRLAHSVQLCLYRTEADHHATVRHSAECSKGRQNYGIDRK